MAITFGCVMLSLYEIFAELLRSFLGWGLILLGLGIISLDHGLAKPGIINLHQLIPSIYTYSFSLQGFSPSLSSFKHLASTNCKHECSEVFGWQWKVKTEV